MRIRPIVLMRRMIAAVAFIAIVAAITVSVHDQLIIRSATGKETALWKCRLYANQLPAPWRFEESSKDDFWRQDAEVVEHGGVFQVPHWVERQEADGSWTRRRCTSTLWCEDFDYWHLKRIQIDGEAPIEMDVIDGPTGQTGRLWMNQLLDDR
jgi:hypothetical protein